MNRLVATAVFSAVQLFSSPFLKAQTPETKSAEAAPTAALTAGEAVDSLTPADLSQFLPLLRENYIAADKLNETEVSRATVQGLLDRLAPGASILAAPTAVSNKELSPFRSEIFEDRVGYLRLGSLSPANLTELDAALELFTAKDISAAVLDLRATPPTSELLVAADVCQRFCPKGKVLFTLKKPNAKDERILTSKEEPRYRGILAVLFDRRAAGAAEVIAAVLRTHTKAMLIGQTTRGETAEFAEFPLPSGKILRIAVGEITLADNVAVFPRGIKPDLAVNVPNEMTDAVLKAELEKGIKELVVETERPRLNEAALVSGNNPEMDAYQAEKRTRGEKTKPPLRDVLLQRALDFITTVSVYEKK